MGRHRPRRLGSRRRTPPHRPPDPRGRNDGPAPASEADRRPRPRRLGTAPRRNPTEPGVALVVHTSGTQGEPKLVQFDRRAIDAAVAASALALHATPQDRWLCCLPLAHVGGLLVLLRSVLLGALVSVHPSFDPAAVSAEPGVTFVSVVPTMLLRLLDAGVDLSRFRAILVGGAALHPPLRLRAERSGARVLGTYGLTESCGGVVYDGFPLAGIGVRIDGEGGIELRGPTMMRAYCSDPDGTARAFTTDGWLRTGDAGTIDADGHLRVEGRLDDLIMTRRREGLAAGGRGGALRPLEGRRRRRGQPPRSGVGRARGRVRRPPGDRRPADPRRTARPRLAHPAPVQGPTRTRDARPGRSAHPIRQDPPCRARLTLAAVAALGFVIPYGTIERHDRRAERHRPRIGAGRLDGGPLHGARRTVAVGAHRPRRRRPAHAHDRGRELPRLPGRNHGPRTHGRDGEAGRALRRGAPARRQRRG